MSDLTTLLHRESLPPSALDLAQIRRLGRRRRWRARAAAGLSVLAVGLALGGVWSLVGGGAGPRTFPATAHQDHRVTGVSDYERRVLAAVPKSYEVDGTVIVSGRLQAGSDFNEVMPPSRIVGAPRALGFHAYGGGAPAGLETKLPRFMEGNPPQDSQVLFDQGPAFLGCTLWPAEHHTDAGSCLPSVLVENTAGQLVYVYGLGTDHFLTPESEMELFLGDDYQGRTWHGTLIGGFAGTDASHVEATLVDGSKVAALVDTGVRGGATLFWATLPSYAEKVVAYDHDGKVVAEHRVKSCSTPVSCEVR